MVGQGPAQHEVQQQQQQQYVLPVMDAMWQAASRTETAQNAAAAAVTTAPHDASALVPATPLLCAPLPCSFLAPGICFTGWQRQAAPAGLRRGLTEAWAVSVTLLVRCCCCCCCPLQLHAPTAQYALYTRQIYPHKLWTSKNSSMCLNVCTAPHCCCCTARCDCW